MSGLTVQHLLQCIAMSHFALKNHCNVTFCFEKPNKNLAEKYPEGHGKLSLVGLGSQKFI